MSNTPASTPVTTMANGQNTSQTSPPPNNAPKYGTLVPNRIFVGGISASTTESELLQLFSAYGTVKAAKIIQDRAGVSKGYGFITFENEEDAKRLREADNIVLRERKLNIAPAIKKQPFSRAFDASSPPAVAQGSPQYFFQPGAMPFYQGGVAYYPQPTAGPTDPNTQQPAVYQPQTVYPAQTAPPQTAAYPPVMFPAPPIYMPQQYPIPVPYEYNYYPNGGAQYMVGGQSGPQSQVPSMQRPNSPPRAPCYSQQLPYNNPPDIYYNMPLYGPVEGAMFSDATGMDMSMSNGALAEMHSTTQHFVPPTRRNRRTTVRRNGSTSLSEIGAGDAPLPASDSVPEACNKMESLKL